MSDDPASAPRSCSTAASTPARSSTSTWTRSWSPAASAGTREVVRQRGSVAALPVLDDGRVVLVRQYRYAVDAFVWELPAGRRDPGETPEEGARRELEEEVGLRAGALEPLLVFWTTPGFCDEVMHLFRATGLEPVPPRPEADEKIESATFTLEEAIEMVKRGEIREGKTLVALLLEAQPEAPAERQAFRRRPGLRHEGLRISAAAGRQLSGGASSPPGIRPATALSRSTPARGA